MVLHDLSTLSFQHAVLALRLKDVGGEALSMTFMEDRIDSRIFPEEMSSSRASIRVST
jgi:hypothetical protein